jgi:phosphoribosylformylglycinamidine cyclo-ligase
MALLLSEADVLNVSEQLEKAGESVFRIGRVEAGERGCTVAGPAESWSSREAWSATHHG